MLVARIMRIAHVTCKGLLSSRNSLSMSSGSTYSASWSRASSRKPEGAAAWPMQRLRSGPSGRGLPSLHGLSPEGPQRAAGDEVGLSHSASLLRPPRRHSSAACPRFGILPTASHATSSSARSGCTCASRSASAMSKNYWPSAALVEHSPSSPAWDPSRRFLQWTVRP
jgi:hypothetical protein